MEEQQEHPMLEQKETVKLIKNTKGYGWEIKLLDVNLERLEKLNNSMIEKFKQLTEFK